MRGRLIAVAVLLTAFAGCGQSTDSTDQSAADQSSTTSEVPSTTAAVPTTRVAPADQGTRPTLQRGDKGEWVIELQQALTRHGFAVTDDGDFGPVTEAAVRDFQAAYGLTVDGVVGSATWEALESPSFTTTSVPHSTASTSTTVPGPTVPEPLVLAADGLGAIKFGDPTDELLAALTAVLGPSDWQGRPNNPAGLVNIWNSDSTGYGLRVSTGTSTEFCGTEGYRNDGVDHFYAWTYGGGLGLTTAGGITIGSTAAEVLAAYPEAAFGQQAETGSGDWTPGIVSIAGGELGLRGWVGGLPLDDYEQTAAQALVELGYSLGPRGDLRDALRALQAAEGLVVTGFLDTPTWLALGLTLPADPEAPVVGLMAGIQSCE